MAPAPAPRSARRSERLQINVTRRTKLLLRFEDMERQKRGLKPRERDETTLVEEAVEKQYGHLWRTYGRLMGDAVDADGAVED